MSWRPTWLLAGIAVALLAFIFLFERHKTPTSLGALPPQRLISFNPGDVTNIQLRVTNQLVLRAERSTNKFWNLTGPINYPAQTYSIEGLLQALSQLTTPASISPDELRRGNQTIADFGLDVPSLTLTLLHGGRRSEIQFGSKTPAGDQVYLQLHNEPNIYIVSSDIVSRLPRQANDWRDTTLINLPAYRWDRIELRQPGNRGFTLQLETNRFVLAKPIAARADMPKVESLLRKLLVARVQNFVSDEPRVDLDGYGLQTPEAEFALVLGTNDVATLQFGKSPTNDASVVYARRMSHTNIVTVPKTLLESLLLSPNELRDHHLFSFSTNNIDTLEVLGSEPFSVRRQGNGHWVAIEPQATLIDSELMNETLNTLLQLEGSVEKDVVTDFAGFGLTQPARQYLVKTTITNATGVVTNRLVAQLDLSAPQNGKVFARRGDETLTVYSIPVSDFQNLPAAAWQLRDRRVWSFTTNQVTKITVSKQGVTRSVVRSGDAKWSLAEGSEGIINPAAVEELVFRLGELRADGWVARGDTNRAQYGFTGEGARITIELKVGDKPHLLNMELGGITTGHVLALANIDGQTWIFKLPFKVFGDLGRYLIVPLLRSPG